MGEATKIQWCDHTFNPWRGCTKVSPGCAYCYAEQQSKRNPGVLGNWGDRGKRVIASESYWRLPLKWDRQARSDGVRRKVFCASLADVFEDRPELDEPRQRLFDLILHTPNLLWLLLTKRPVVMADWLCGSGVFGSRNAHVWGQGWPNVWLGVSVEDQARSRERLPVLLSVPAVVHWLSCEPLLGPLDLGDCLHEYHGCPPDRWPYGPVRWVVVGGESGTSSRPCEVSWVRSIVRQCRQVNRACFVKQLGACAYDPENGIAGARLNVPEEAAPLVSLRLRDKKGGDPDEWPEDVRVRQFPFPYQ